MAATAPFNKTIEMPIGLLVGILNLLAESRPADWPCLSLDARQADDVCAKSHTIVVRGLLRADPELSRFPRRFGSAVFKSFG